MKESTPNKIASLAQNSIYDAFNIALKECSLNNEDFARLSAFAKTVKKLEHRSNFHLERTIADKNVAVKLLDQTIEGLRLRSEELEDREESLAATVEQLKVANQDMQHFMHVASHDLKTPLRSIGSFANLIKRRHSESLSEEVRENFGYIIRSAKSMNRVIDDLVRFNEISQISTLELLDLNEIASEVVHNLYADISEHDANIEVKDLDSAMATRSGISQLLQNLIRNAIVYRHPERRPEICVSRLTTNNRNLLTVTDNGIGLDNAYQEKAFEPFKRVGDVTKPGTGMGLAICRRIVRKMGGDIWFEGKVGVGTTFYVSFKTPVSELINTQVAETAA